MKLNERWRGYGIAVAAMAFAGCSDIGTEPKSRSSSIKPRHEAQDVQNASLISNSIKYREQTLPHQSNRSGAASLTSRALLGKDGNTVLEVTTGELDEPGAPGNISKLQAKLLDGNLEVLATQNFNGLTGPVQTLTFPGLARHGFIQTQGNVRDIDANRTDVVTVTERVNLRPDLAVTDVVAPEQSKPGVDFIVVANVQEMNGDVGARDDCVLYVDGSEAARISGQWVADGDMVNCAFRTSIAAAGTHRLEVRSENVIPGDWDMANNSASRTIEIVNPEVRLSGYLYTEEREYQHSSFRSWRYDFTYGRVIEGVRNYAQAGRYSYTYFSAEVSGEPGIGPLTSIDYSLSSGGSQISAVSASNLNSGNCAYFYGYDWLQVCSYDGYSYVNGGRYSGRAVYYSYYFSYDSYYGYSYYYDSGSPVWNGDVMLPGNDVTLDFRAEGTTGTALVANASLTLSNWHAYAYDQPLACWSGSWYDYYYRSCSEYHDRGTSRSGFTYF